jgi:hypothetical protein
MTKDKSAPKKPKNGYVIFCQETQAELKKTNPGLTGKDSIKELSKLWRELPDNLKQEYSAKAELDKQRYVKEMESYVPKPQEETPKKKSKKISRPYTAYILFSMDKIKEIKKQNSEMKSNQIIQEAAKLWKSATEQEKAKYKKEAERLKQEFVSESSELVDE